MHELGTFVVTYPCWALVQKASIIARDGTGKVTSVTAQMQFLVLDDTSGGSMFPLFTDGDLASRFKKASGGMEDFVIFALKSAEDLAYALRTLPSTVDTVTLDKPEFRGRPYAIWPTKYAIQKIEAGEPL